MVATKYRYHWRDFLKCVKVRKRLKRLVNGTHWQLEDYYGSGDDFDKIVERVYKHFK